MTYLPWLGAITLVAAVVTGGLGYGFSSLTVPLSLMWLSNRVLNPALVLVEVGLNAYVLLVNHRAIPRVWRRVLPLVAGLVPGILVGTLIISRVDPAWLKLATFVVLTPLILLQAAGVRRPIQSERRVGPAVGATIGVLYSVTTISGPPLALVLNNQGFSKDEFRAAIGLVRLFESTLTAVAYASIGLMTSESAALLPSILPSLALGVPIGAWLIRRMDGETFRRLSMSFDAWVVAFGLSVLLGTLGLAGPAVSSAVLISVVTIDLVLLSRFFTRQRSLRLGARL